MTAKSSLLDLQDNVQPTHLLPSRNVGRFLDGAAEVANRAYVVIERQHAISGQIGETASYSDHHGGLVFEECTCAA